MHDAFIRCGLRSTNRRRLDLTACRYQYFVTWQLLDAMASNVEFNFNRADNRLLVSTLRMVLYPTEHKPDPPAKPQMMTNWGFNAMWFVLTFFSPKVRRRRTGNLMTPEAAANAPVADWACRSRVAACCSW